jgi:hypothetical protein
MDFIIDAITEWIKDFLIEAITGNLSNMFGDVNTKVATIAGEVGKTPEQWNSGVFSMIHSLSESVIVPIAGLVIAAVLSYELIRMVIDRNNMHDFDTFIFFKWIIKAGIAAYVVSHTFDFTPTSGAVQIRPPALIAADLSAGSLLTAAFTTCPVPRRRAFTINARLSRPPKPNRGTLSFSREPMTAQGQCPTWGFMWVTG